MNYWDTSVYACATLHNRTTCNTQIKLFFVLNVYRKFDISATTRTEGLNITVNKFKYELFIKHPVCTHIVVCCILKDLTCKQTKNVILRDKFNLLFTYINTYYFKKHFYKILQLYADYQLPTEHAFSNVT